MPSEAPSMSLPATKIPWLDTADHGNVLERSANTGTERWHRSWYGGRKEATTKDQASSVELSHEKIFRSFATFLLSFTGDDEVTFNFTQCVDPGQGGHDQAPTTGVVHATSADSDSVRRCQPSINIIQQNKLHHSDFAIQIGQPQWIEDAPLLLLPGIFAVVVDSHGVSGEFRKEAIPHSFQESILGVLYGTLEAAVISGHWDSDSTTQQAALDIHTSVLNHPPRALPENWGNGLEGGPSEEWPAQNQLHQSFASRAIGHPARQAIDFITSLSGDHITYTYAELDWLSDVLAQHIVGTLTDSGRQSQHIVPAFISTSPELYISWIAVLKAGCAFCPLPVDAPPEFLTGIIDDVSAGLILGRGSAPSWASAEELGTPFPSWVDVQGFAKALGPPPTNGSHANHLPIVKSSDLAYVMYTSGSTGKPKGVQITHLSAACSISSHILSLPGNFKSPADSFRWFQFAAPTFDPSVMEIFVTLSSGGTICACERTLALTDPESAISALQADIMMATPSMAALLRPTKVKTLRHLWTMGETLGRSVIENFSHDSALRQDDGPRNLLNAYGPTEGAINCTLHEAVSSKQRGSVIGSPISTCSILVVDTSQKDPVPVPLGFPGELAIGGPQVSLGYINRPNADVTFVTSEEYGRLYRTGDLVRVVEDVNKSLVIDFLGRISSEQTKLSGRRVELGEIEAAMTAPTIAEVAAMATSPLNSNGGTEAKQIIAFICPRDPYDAEDLLHTCLDQASRALQPHMRPSRYFIVQQMPHSASGKLNRKALERMYHSPHAHGLKELGRAGTIEPEPDKGGSHELDEYFQEVHKAIAHAVQSTEKHITPNASLASLGLDSLRAVRFLQNTRESGLGSLQITDVLACRSVRELVNVFRQAKNHGSADSDHNDSLWEATVRDFRERHEANCLKMLSVSQEDVELLVPATTSQVATLSSFLLTSGTSTNPTSSIVQPIKTYINHSIYRISVEHEPEDVCSAWLRVLGRHEMMRTLFVQVDDDLTPFAQCVLDSKYQLAQVELTRHQNEPDATFDDVISKAVKAAETSITLERPAVRITLVQFPGRSAIVFSLLHSIFDGSSLRLLLQDVEREYQGLAPLERPGILAATKRHFTSNREQAAEHWKSYLERSVFIPFPCLRRAIYAPEDGRCETKSLVSDFTLQTLRNHAAKMHSSPLAILQGAWALILSAYTGSTDVTFGSVMADRFTDELERCLAPTLTVVPIRVRTDGEASRTNAKVALHLTGENATAIRYLHHPISSAHYDTTFAFQDFGGSTGHDLLYDEVSFPVMHNDQAVMIEVWPTKTGHVQFRATYKCSILDEQAADLMLIELARETKNILTFPDQLFHAGSSASSLPRQLLSISSNAEQYRRRRETILLHQSFKERVKERPDDPALTFYWDVDDTTKPLRLTYRDLDQQSKHVAAYLKRRLGGVTKPWVVPICMEKCPDLYVAILGILNAGAAWCPVDFAYPSARQRHLIERTGANMVLTASALAADALPENVEVLDVSKLRHGLVPTNTNGDDLDGPQASITGADLAYVLFTSGTTGLPKGVPITHDAASSSIQSFAECISANYQNAPVRYMQFAAFTFDVFVRDLFTCWRLGGNLVSATRDVMLSSFTELANLAMATHASFTPTFASTLRRKDFDTLRVVTIGGEELPPQVADDWSDDVNLYNIYGPAETAINATARRIHSTSKSSNIGHTLPSVEAYVMQDGRPVMTHAVGELVVAGVQVSPGYWKDPETTRKAFSRNEFVKKRVYHTGDMVRQLGDGSFDFLGRTDDMVKIRGMRVELGEIASVCRDGHPLVSKAHALYTTIPGSSEKAVVCFLAAPRLQINEDQGTQVLQSEEAVIISRAVLQHALSQLPKHMVPDLCVVLSAIPQTPSAKADRRELLRLLRGVDTSPSRTPTSEEDSDPFDSEWQEQHANLREMLGKVTKIPNIRIVSTTTLAEVGIDSIGAIKLSSRLRTAGHKVSVADLIRCIFVSDIVSLLTGLEAEVVGGKWQEEAASFNQKWKPIVAKHLSLDIDTFTIAPTTAMQEGVLTESLRDPLSYWGNFFFNLSEHVDLRKLRRAWRSVTASNEVLRTAFLLKASLDDGGSNDDLPELGFLQVISNGVQVDWDEQDMNNERDITDGARAIFEHTAARHSSQAFSAPPWAVRLLKSGNKRIMMLSMHHSLYDAESIEFLLNDVVMAYSKADHESKRCQLNEAIMRLGLRQDRDKSLEFWRGQLGSFVATNGDGMSPANYEAPQSKEAIHRTHELQSAMSLSALSLAAQKLGAASVSAIFRVAWGSLLSEFCESRQILFAEIRSERVLDSRLADTIAPLAGVYPVPFVMDGTPRQLVNAQFQLSRDSLKYGSVRPTVVRDIIGRPAEDLLYPAVLVFHNRVEGGHKSRQRIWENMGDLLEISVEHMFALNVFEEANDGLRLSLSVNERIMSRKVQMAFLHSLDGMVQAIVQHPDAASILELTEHFPKQLQSISATNKSSNSGHADWQPTHWIENWANLHPTWTAVEVVEMTDLGEKQTTLSNYDQLNAKTNQVAHWITQKNVRSRMIGVCLGRTLLSFAVILGVMKSGNTYVPIDDSLPLERKRFLLEDSNAAMLLTSPDVFAAEDFDLPRELLIVNVEDRVFLKDLAAMNHQNPDIDADLAQEAYLLYTSGSTGKPKGVRVSRRNLSAFMEAQSELICKEAPATRRLVGVGKYLCLASRAFDVHIGEMFLAWRHGLCALAGARMTLLDNLKWTLQDLHVTHASFVPSLLDQTGLTPDDAPDLVFLGVGGEKMTPRAQALWSSHDRVNLINAYGPTEVTVGCCSGRLYPDSDTRCIGKPLGDSVAHILVPGTDTHVKRGMPGELAFTGSLVASGYHNRPDATGFVTTVSGERMYRTGDMVIMMPDDSILFLGRKDDQVKVRGQRLELGEISEAVRASSTDSVDVTTLLLKHPEMARQQLVTFVANSSEKSSTEPIFLHDEYRSLDTRVRPTIEKRLPAYMVPDLLLPVSSLPLTQTSAKVDNKLLKSLFDAISLNQLFGENEAHVNSSPIRSLTATEQQIVDIIKSTSSRGKDPKVKPDSSVFQLGVDSLGAIALAIKLKKLNYKCSVTDVLQNPTIEQLAGLSTMKSQDTTQANYEAEIGALRDDLKVLDKTVRPELDKERRLPQQDVEHIWPCYPLQEVLVAHSLGVSSSEDSNYINHTIFEVSSHVDADALLHAWETVMRANAILRTCFLCRADSIVQTVLAADRIQLPWTELSLPQEELTNGLKARRGGLSEEIIASIDSQPPMRLTFAASSGEDEQPGRRLLMLSIHHGLYDMDSLAMIMDDVQRCYNTSQAPLRPSTTPLIEYMASQKRNSDDARRHWSSILKDWKQPERYNLSEMPIATTHRAFKESLASLKDLCADRGLTLPALMQGLFGFVLAQSQSRNDVTFGVVLSGRALAIDGVENIMAPCITTIPQSVNLARDGKTLADVISTLQQRAFSSMAYQHTSLRDIQAWIEASGPLFNTIFSFVSGKESAPDDQEVSDKVLTYVEGHMALDYALAVECEADDSTDKLTLRANFCRTPPFEAADMMLEKMELLAKSVLHGGDIEVASTSASAMTTTNASSRPTYDETSWSTIDKKIRDLVVSFCNVDERQVSKSAPFIRFGIDSITAIRFGKELRDKGFQVSSADVLRNPSVGALSKHLCQDREDSPSSKVSPGRPSADASPTRGDDKQNEQLSIPQDAKPWGSGDKIVHAYHVTPLQAGMLSSTLAVDPRLYSHHHAFELPLNTDLAALKGTWKALLTQHDILRTTFHSPNETEGSWTAAVHTKPKLTWEVVDSNQGVQDAIRQLVEQTQYPDAASFARRPVKVTIIRTPSRMVLVASLHHVLYDGISVQFLFQDLWRLFNDEPVPHRPPFYEAAAAISRSYTTATKFWADSIRGYESVQVPLEQDAESGQRINSAELLVADASSDLADKCARLSTTVVNVSLLAFGKALCSLCGARDVLFGNVVAGRNLAIDGADMIAGPMFNTLPFRVRLAEVTATNEKTLREFQSFSDESLDYQHASLAEVQKIWRKGRETREALFDSLFVFQKAGEGGNDNGWKPYESEDADQKTLAPSEYALNFEVHQRGDGGLFVRAFSRISEPRLEDFVKLFGQVLIDIIDYQERLAVAVPEGLSDLPLTTAKTAGDHTQGNTVVFDEAALTTYFEPLSKILSDATQTQLSMLKPNTSIFSIGIDSILAIRVSGICRQKDVPLTTTDVIRGVKIGKLCELALANSSKRKTPSEPSHASQSRQFVDDNVYRKALQKVSVSDGLVDQVLPTLPGQDYHLALWLKSGRTLYEPTWVFRSHETLDEGRLQTAWANLRIRHSVLRTCFAAIESGKSVQVVLSKKSVQDKDSTFSVQTVEDLEESVKDSLRDIFRTPSTLDSPPVRLRLVHGGDAGDALLLTLHHATFDAWSMGLLVKELETLYRDNSLTSQPPSFSNFIRDVVSGQSPDDQETFWKEHLSTAQRTVVKYDHKHHSDRQEAVANGDETRKYSRKRTFTRFESPTCTRSSLEQRARTLGVTPHSILLLAFSHALSSISGSASPIFGYFTAGRSSSFPCIESLPGPTVNMLPVTLPFFSKTLDKTTCATVLHQVQDHMSARTTYEQSSLRDVLRWAGFAEVPFNAHINILWNEEILVPSSRADDALLRPWPLGVPSDYAATEPIPGRTAVDGLDVGFLPGETLFVDVGTDGEGRVAFGAGCDPGVMDEGELGWFLRVVDREIRGVVDWLGDL